MWEEVIALVLALPTHDDPLRLPIPSEIVDLPTQRSDRKFERVLGLRDIPDPYIPRYIS